MSRLIFYLILILIDEILSSKIYGQQNYVFCATDKFIKQCDGLQNQVKCEIVQDSVECAQLLKNGIADFGVVSAESAYHLATLGWDGITVVKEIRNRERVMQQYDYQSVVVVSKDHKGGLEGLRGSKFCHPGLHYDGQKRWSERFLKHFERTVVPYDCNDGTSPAEIETSALSNFFSSVCRPGKWSNNIQEDSELKVKYPKLCNLCDNSVDCSYGNSTKSSHRKALECLSKSNKTVTYVDLQEAKDFFEDTYSTEEYSFLCPNGNLQLASTDTPCVWLTQPWKLVIAISEMSGNLNQKLSRWITSPGIWENVFKNILLDGDSFADARGFVEIKDYFNPVRPHPTVANSMCNTTSIWCTTSNKEKKKCEVLAAAALTTGILPILECSEPTLSTVSCLSDIATRTADFMWIDSFYGYTARSDYDLTSALYGVSDHQTSLIALVKNNSDFENFNNLEKSRACFARYGSIGSLALFNAIKENKTLENKYCDFDDFLENYFVESCTPGVNNSNTFCQLCKNGTKNCKVKIENKEALTCLSEVGDVAVVEIQNLKEHAQDLKLDPNDFRVICRNNTPAAYNGFDVDEACYLTTIVDGEIVVRKNSKKTSEIINALSSLVTYLQSDPDFKMFESFKGNKDLLFKDSTMGLISSSSSSFSNFTQNYIELLQNNQQLVTTTNNQNLQKVNYFNDGKGSGRTVTSNLMLTLTLLLVTSALIS